MKEVYFRTMKYNLGHSLIMYIPGDHVTPWHPSSIFQRAYLPQAVLSSHTHTHTHINSTVDASAHLRVCPHTYVNLWLLPSIALTIQAGTIKPVTPGVHTA